MKNQFYPVFFGLVFFLSLLSPAIIFSQPSMRANLHIVAANGSSVLMDGNLTNYDSTYSNGLDMYDAWKMNNFSENFGIFRGNSVLVIERRKNIGTCDTTFFKMWNMQYRNYRLQIITKNFNAPGMSAYVFDKFLNTKTAIKINDTSYVNFTVNANTGSWNALRFELIYAKPDPVFLFLTSSASRINNQIEVKWNVANERNIVKYVVEHSLNGTSFTGIGENASQKLTANNYQFVPAKPFVTDNYYRIKAIHTNGTTYYSEISKVAGEILVTSVFPNPIVDKSFFVRMKGVNNKSQLQLVSMSGVVYKISQANVIEAAENLVKVILPSQMHPGMYQLKMILEDKTINVVGVRVL